MGQSAGLLHEALELARQEMAAHARAAPMIRP